MVESQKIGEEMWKRAPAGVHYAVQAMMDAAVDHPGNSAHTGALDMEDIQWAAMRVHKGGVALLGGAQGGGVTTLTDWEGCLVTPASQFVTRLPAGSAGCSGGTALTMQAAAGRISMEIGPGMDQCALLRLVAGIALAAADHEAAALRRAALEAGAGQGPAVAGGLGGAPRGRGAGAGGSGPRLAEEIGAAADSLRGRGHGGQGLVMYTHPACIEALQDAGLGPKTGGGIVCAGSRALGRPPDAGGPRGLGQVSVMFDPKAAYKMSGSPRLMLEARRGRGGESLLVAATHVMAVDVDGTAVCLLPHGAGTGAAPECRAGPAARSLCVSIATRLAGIWQPRGKAGGGLLPNSDGCQEAACSGARK